MVEKVERAQADAKPGALRHRKLFSHIEIQVPRSWLAYGIVANVPRPYSDAGSRVDGYQCKRGRVQETSESWYSPASKPVRRCSRDGRRSGQCQFVRVAPGAPSAH